MSPCRAHFSRPSARRSHAKNRASARPLSDPQFTPAVTHERVNDLGGVVSHGLFYSWGVPYRSLLIVVTAFLPASPEPHQRGGTVAGAPPLFGARASLDALAVSHRGGRRAALPRGGVPATVILAGRR